MKKFLCLLILFLVLTGCILDENQELSYSQVQIESTDEDIQEFINVVKEKNGVYLYTAGEKLFVLLNSSTVKQGEKAIYFTDFEVKSDIDTLNLYFEEESTDEYVNKDLHNQVLYEVKLDKEYEVINLFRNNEVAYFTTVGTK